MIFVCEFHILIETVLYIAWFAAWFNLTGGDGQGSGPDPEALRRRLHGNGNSSEDPDGRDGSDSNCSDNMSGTTTTGGGGGGNGSGGSGGAFRPTTSTGEERVEAMGVWLEVLLIVNQILILNLNSSLNQVPLFILLTYCLTCIPRDSIHHLRCLCCTTDRQPEQRDYHPVLTQDSCLMLNWLLPPNTPPSLATTRAMDLPRRCTDLRVIASRRTIFLDLWAPPLRQSRPARIRWAIAV